jgi:hypothetical protein
VICDVDYYLLLSFGLTSTLLPLGVGTLLLACSSGAAPSRPSPSFNTPTINAELKHAWRQQQQQQQQGLRHQQPQMRKSLGRDKSVVGGEQQPYCKMEVSGTYHTPEP